MPSTTMTKMVRRTSDFVRYSIMHCSCEINGYLIFGDGRWLISIWFWHRNNFDTDQTKEFRQRTSVFWSINAKKFTHCVGKMASTQDSHLHLASQKMDKLNFYKAVTYFFVHDFCLLCNEPRAIVRQVPFLFKTLIERCRQQNTAARNLN